MLSAVDQTLLRGGDAFLLLHLLLHMGNLCSESGQCAAMCGGVTFVQNGASYGIVILDIELDFLAGEGADSAGGHPGQQGS